LNDLNDKSRRKDVQYHIFRYKPSLVALVETKVALRNTGRLSGCVYQRWSSCHNFDIVDTVRIWTSWDPRVWSCNVVTKSSQQITLELTNKG